MWGRRAQTQPGSASPCGAVRHSPALPPALLPGHQGGDDVCDGAIELSQHLLYGPRDGQLLAQVLGPTDLLPVLPDDLGQLLTPGARGPRARSALWQGPGTSQSPRPWRPVSAGHGAPCLCLPHGDPPGRGVQAEPGQHRLERSGLSLAMWGAQPPQESSPTSLAMGAGDPWCPGLTTPARAVSPTRVTPGAASCDPGQHGDSPGFPAAGGTVRWFPSQPPWGQAAAPGCPVPISHRAASPVPGSAGRGDAPGLQHVQGALRRAAVPRQLLPPLPLNQLVVQDGRLLLAQQLQGFLVLLCQLLRGDGLLAGDGGVTAPC